MGKDFRLNSMHWLIKVKNGREKRHIPILIIQPEDPLEIDMLSFTAKDIGALVDKGLEDAKKVIKAAQGDKDDPGHVIAQDLTLP